MQRRTFVRRRGFRRRTHSYLWVREAFDQLTPVHQPTPNLNDLLETFRTQAGVTLNLPAFTIWRVLIKVSIHISLQNPAASDGVHFALFVDDKEVSPTINALVRPFAKQYMMWDQLYASEVVAQSSITTAPVNVPVLYRAYDIKTHRKLENIEQTLWASFVETGAASIIDYSLTYSILLRHKV